VKACAISPGQVATQECFDANPLTFVEDKLYGAPVHPLYPGRAYIPRTDFAGLTRGSDGNYPFHHLFKLPNGLRGDLILLQWYYLTANSCVAEGYNTYAWPEGFYPGDLPVCQSIPPDGRGVPEQFWNCAEVAIKVGNGCGGVSSAPPVASGLPTSQPTALPTMTATTLPTESPTNGNLFATTTSSTATTTATTTTSSTTSSTFTGELVLDNSPRCGTSELDAREQCKPICATDSDCGTGEFCWSVHTNYCGSIPQRVYENPTQSSVISRCGVSEEMARTFCGEPCSWQCSKPGETCIAVSIL
jgi:hypothetical protein